MDKGIEETGLGAAGRSLAAFTDKCPARLIYFVQNAYDSRVVKP